MEQAGFTLDESLVGRLQEYARTEGLSPQEALETALGLGLELCAAEVGRRDQRLRDVEAAVHDLLGMVMGLGPPAFGALMLLIAWSARDVFGVSEDELCAEILTAGRGQWEASLAELGVVISAESPTED
jgi:hypothetical protein